MSLPAHQAASWVEVARQRRASNQILPAADALEQAASNSANTVPAAKRFIGRPFDAVGKDAARGKATFVSLLGLEAARKRAGDLVGEAIAAMEPYGQDAETLRELARFVIARRS